MQQIKFFKKYNKAPIHQRPHLCNSNMVHHGVKQVETLFDVFEEIDSKLMALGIVEVDGVTAYVVGMEVGHGRPP